VAPQQNNYNHLNFYSHTHTHIVALGGQKREKKLIKSYYLACCNLSKANQSIAALPSWLPFCMAFMRQHSHPFIMIFHQFSPADDNAVRWWGIFRAAVQLMLCRPFHVLVKCVFDIFVMFGGQSGLWGGGAEIFRGGRGENVRHLMQPAADADAFVAAAFCGMSCVLCPGSCILHEISQNCAHLLRLLL